MNAPSTPATSTAASPAPGPIARLGQAWQSISPRERRLVLAAGLVVLIGLVVSLLYWSRSERGRLARSLPRAEALGTDAAGGVAALRFEDGRLDLTLNGPAAARAEAVVGLLAALGLLADLRRDGATTHLLLRRETLQ